MSKRRDNNHRPKYLVGDLIFDPDNRTIERNGEVTILPKLSFRLLYALMRHAPQTVSADRLIVEVWEQTVVSPETLTQRVKLLRDVIGDDRQHPEYIETRRGHGYRLIPPVKLLDKNEQKPKKWRPLAFVVIMLAAIALGLFISLDSGRIGILHGTPRSIAVLPFTNLSADVEQQYFSDGLAEELLNLLTRVPGLQVAARTSSFSFREEHADIPTIAQKLNVSYVLEGSVRKTGNDLRISVQLIKADDGYNLWSETYDRTLDDIFVLQREIASSVTEALKVTLLADAPTVRETRSDVYNLYLKARYFDNLKGEENWDKAVSNYRQALAIDPAYAPAWAGLSITYRYQANSYLGDFDNDIRLAREAAHKALELDEGLAIAWSNLGQVELIDGWDWAAAQIATQKALQLEPGNAEVLNHAAGLATVTGRLREAITLLEQSVTLDPLSQSSHNGLGLAYMNAGRLDDAEAQFRQLLELNPQYPWGSSNLGRVKLLKSQLEEALAIFESSADGPWRDLGLAMALGGLQRPDEARTALERLENDYGIGTGFMIAAVYAWRGDTDRAFDWLQRSWESRETGIIFVPADPFFAKLHGDPRWVHFLNELGLTRLNSQT